MTLSEMIALLSRIQQMAGDLPVVFRSPESDAVTVLESIGVNIDPISGAAGGNVTILHAPAPTAPPEPVPAIPVPVDPAAAPADGA